MDDSWTVAGLPLHPLLVHLVVILVPLTAIALVLAVLWPAARRRLGVVTPLAALALVPLVPITQQAGEQLASEVGPVPGVAEHQALGEQLLPWTIALFVAAAAQWAWFRWGAPRQSGASRTAVHVALAVASVVVAGGITTLVVLIGESGARAVWGTV